jgi:hypothetical protein
MTSPVQLSCVCAVRVSVVGWGVADRVGAVESCGPNGVDVAREHRRSPNVVQYGKTGELE